MYIYQNYHSHKDFTNPRVPDCAVHIEDYAKRAASLGHSILSTVEHGWQGNYYECYKIAKKYNLKLLIGAEAYWVKDRLEKDNTNSHICLLAKNENGRQALNDILSEANLTGFYNRPRVDIPLLLSLPPEDIWVTTACIAFWYYEDIEDIIVQLYNHFKDNFFLEVQYHNTDKQRELNKKIQDLHYKYNIPIIMGCDSHYILEEDSKIRDDFLLSKNMEYSDEIGWYLDYPDGDTAYTRFANQGVLSHDEIIEAISNTNKFLDVENYNDYIFNSEIKMPSIYPSLSQNEKDDIYRGIISDSWNSYKPQVDQTKIPLYESEINNEMQVVIDTKMSDYFLINHAVIKKGKENGGVLTTTGRGCFTGDALVNTLYGEKKICDIDIGDIIFDKFGNQQTVTNTFCYHINEPLVEIVTSNMALTRCTLDHKILCWKNNAKKWIKASKLSVGCKLVSPTLNYLYHNSNSNYKYNDITIIAIHFLPRTKTTVYDIEVENTHSYVLNGFVVHNSAVSWITNKLLGFTEVDRIAASVKMYPDRFMSTTRILQSGSLPDIDMNVADATPFALAQKQILGDDHAYPMLAYGTMQKSAAWKLYAKSQNIPFEIANKISEEIKKYELALKHADEDEKDSIDPLDYISKEYHQTYLDSAPYLGLIVSWSIAPCSYLLYSGSIRKEIGLVRIKDNICCLMDGHWAEEAHFLKNDLLTVKTVDLTDKIYKRIGIPKHNVNELLDICKPDDPCWKMYSIGATCCLNQVEKTGTSARISKYKPKNISELCAFVAAIRPGFKSMYKKFETREPFSYGVKAFDNLIQTEEMPYSFVLYQEMEMAAMNYAGIPMDECYTAIKNIAKKRADKVLAYKEQFVDGFTKAILNEGKSQQEAEELAHMLWKIVEDSASYSFNACVSGSTVIMRMHNAEQFTVEEMYKIRHSPSYARLKKQISLRGKWATFGYGPALSMFDDKTLHMNNIVDIRIAGIQQTYRITVESGKYIDCTAQHKFPTPNGIFHFYDLDVGDELYVADQVAFNFEERKLSGKTRIERIISIVALDEEMTYDIEMDEPAHNFVANEGIITSNSHSYCVSLDSLYGAWLKAHYPLEFYETALTLYDSKGDKDKMSALKEEAEKYFNIHFPPFKFRQDNRKFVADHKTNSIMNKLSSIKGFGMSVCNLLYQCGQETNNSFFNVLAWLDKHSFKSSKVEPLIKIGYFSEFGNTAKLLRLLTIWDYFNQGTTKKISKDKLKEPLLSFVKDHGTDLNQKGEPLKTYTITDMQGLLQDIEYYILFETDIPEVDIHVLMENQREILGYIDITTNDPNDRRKLFIEDIFPLMDKWSGKGGVWKYRVKTKSIGSGKSAELSLSTGLYNMVPIQKGNIINCIKDPVKDKKGYWNLTEYEVIG